MELPELLLIDKPKGISSFSVIRELRRRTGVRKFGHAGTLDPLATGLMLIGVEKGTKRLTELIGLDKEYIADIRVGERRSTGDLEGDIIAEKVYCNDVRREQVEAALAHMCTTLTLPVSAYSAIKKDGVPMYKRARKAAKEGNAIAQTDVPVRAMTVYETELLDFVPQEDRLQLKVRFKVSSGTYIRSLAEALGEELGYPATLSDLRRTKIGSYNIEDARTLEDFGNQ
jgi:tRNA pseudouridine55 synthase